MRIIHLATKLSIDTASAGDYNIQLLVFVWWFYRRLTQYDIRETTYANIVDKR